MKLLFVSLSTLEFDVSTPDREPLGGSESCLCYLARHLAKRGHDVTLLTRLPKDTPDTVMGVRHRPAALVRDKSFFKAQAFETIITVNAVVACPRFKEYSPGAVNIFWDHLPPDQPPMPPLANPLVRDTIDSIVYVSEWQKEATEKAFNFAGPSHIIANGVTPSFENMFASLAELRAAKQNRAAYTSVPYRGLSVLLDAMNGLRADTVLDVYSSMRVYQAEDYEQESILRRAREMPRVVCHGSVSQTELAVRLKPAAFLTYPCVMTETFCLAVLEALAAGMKVIASDTGGIRATAMGFADLLPVGVSGEQFVSGYRRLIEKNITEFTAHPDAWAERMFEQVQTVNRLCTWAARARDWEDFLGQAIETTRLNRHAHSANQ